MSNIIISAIAVLSIVNILSFVLVGADKHKSVHSSERVPEVYFFFLASCFGSLGVFVGMFVFRHKTKKIYFPVGIGLLLVQQIFLWFYVSKIL